MKSQAAVEYMVIIAIALVIATPIIYYSLTEANTEVKLNEINSALNDLKNTAETIYTLGPGSKDYIPITLPEGIESVSISGKEILFKLRIFEGTSDVFIITKANVTGNIPITKGIHYIQLEMLESGVVLIGELSSSCGDNICESFETCSTCSKDCGACICGNNVCEASEDCNSCPGDCGSCDSGNCGNNICDSNENTQNCSQDCPTEEETGKAFLDRGIENGWYFKTDGIGLATTDSQMKSLEDITLNLLDDDINTPSTTSVIRTRLSGGKNYEGFIVKDNSNSKNYGKILLYGRVRIIDQDPFKLRVFRYKSDGNTIDTANYIDFSIPASVLNQKVKWVELDITNIAHLEDSFGFMKFRVTAQEDSLQDNKRLQFSELHIKVEELE